MGLLSKFSLILDGSILFHVLEDERIEKKLMKLVDLSEGIITSRISPNQKLKIINFVKKRVSLKKKRNSLKNNIWEYYFLK